MTAPVRTNESTARRLMGLYLGTGLAIWALMALAGLTMRLEQAQAIALDVTRFYSLMTLHGVGMITALTLCGMGGLWYLVACDTPMDWRVGCWAWSLMALGVIAVLISVFPGGFGAAWTFLYPLPFIGASWPAWATGTFLIGLMLVTLGWTAWCFQILAAVLGRYGGWRGALAWDLVFHGREFKRAGRVPPPPQTFAALTASVDGLVTAATATLLGVALLAHWISPAVDLDPLWAKNLTYLFGHAIANLTIYMVIGLVYVALPRYTDRHWDTSAVLAVAWWGTLVFVVTAEFHHLYMDFAEPRPLEYLGEAVSYLSGLPVAVVTVFGGALLVYRSAMRWTLGSLFMYAGFVGWIVGGIGALLDATVPFNVTLHNTLWVVAHFHTYLLGGVFLFVAGWVFHVLEEAAGASSAPATLWAVGTLVFGGEALLLLPWYISGAAGVPRRYSMQIPPGPQLSAWASAGAILLLIGLALAMGAAIGVWRRRGGRPSPMAPGAPAAP